MVSFETFGSGLRAWRWDVNAESGKTAAVGSGDAYCSKGVESRPEGVCDEGFDCALYEGWEDSVSENYFVEHS